MANRIHRGEQFEASPVLLAFDDAGDQEIGAGFIAGPVTVGASAYPGTFGEGFVAGDARDVGGFGSEDDGRLVAALSQFCSGGPMS